MKVSRPNEHGVLEPGHLEVVASRGRAFGAVNIALREDGRLGYGPGDALRSRHHRRGKARRWKAERTHSWNRASRLLIRCEKKVASYFGFLHLPSSHYAPQAFSDRLLESSVLRRHRLTPASST